jgi:hypothetical protein
MEILKETLWTSPTYLHERAVRVRLEELPAEAREFLEDFFGGEPPDPVDLVAGHYHVEAGDEDLYLVVRKGDLVLATWDVERFKEAARIWRWVMGIDDGKAA